MTEQDILINDEQPPTTYQSYSEKKGILITDIDLIVHGCKNCIWRMHSQCPHEITSSERQYSFDDEGTMRKGYCPEYVDFLSGFAEGSNSTSKMWEKFSLFLSRIQSMDDYSSFLALSDEIKLLENKQNPNDDDVKLLKKLEQKKEMLKLWWERLNVSVQKGYTKIADREDKLTAEMKRPGIEGNEIPNFNRLPVENKPRIEDK